jgi:hypothetical protein
MESFKRDRTEFGGEERTARAVLAYLRLILVPDTSI